jgi:hypothetical protein
MNSITQDPSILIALTPGLIPIVIGITGHRDIPFEDEPRLFNAVTKALKEITDKTPKSQHVLLSALAEGADRIAARAALDSGWILGAILPAPIAIYEQDFTTKESHAEFHELLAKALWVEELPAKETSPDAYLDAGIRMARQSIFLLALWDGNESTSKGGTADIVNLFLDGIPDIAKQTTVGPTDNFLPETRPVLHILTRRTLAPDEFPTSEVGSIFKFTKGPDGSCSSVEEFNRWKNVIGQIDQFNSIAKSYLKDNLDWKERMIEEDKNALNFPPSAAYAHALFYLSDKISQKAQNTRNRLMWGLFGLAIAAIFCQQTYSGPIFEYVWLLAAFGFGILATALHFWGVNAKLEQKYLDYRSLSEGCRVQRSWKRAGVAACAADHFLRDQRDELEWLRQAIRTTELLPGKLELNADRVESVATEWIDDQRNWFVGDGQGSIGKSDKNEKIHCVWKRIAKIFFWFGLSVIALILLLHILFEKTPPSEIQWMIVASGMLFCVSGIVEVFINIKAYPEQARSYRSMGIALGVARSNLNVALKNEDLAMAENILLGAGRDALAENGGWLLLHRDRPTQVQLV